jgi:hypothetical protein
VLFCHHEEKKDDLSLDDRDPVLLASNIQKELLPNGPNARYTNSVHSVPPQGILDPRVNSDYNLDVLVKFEASDTFIYD